MTPNDKRLTAIIVLSLSAFFFVLGMMYPLMQTGYGIGPITLRQEKIYLISSFSYFFNQGEVFIGFILLFFTIIFPVVKYLFLFYVLAGHKLPAQKSVTTLLEVINKWSMLDVFVVAVLILNMKFSSEIIISRLEAGTSLFAISIVLLMTASLIAGRMKSAGSTP